ncbi:MAG: hypothetical protein EXS14_06850 [Planctomycetes bacterium]|nr:hypothetical protein [Planctomycetota bacterium]
MQPFLALFDIDGTLLRPSGLGRRSLAHTFSELYARPEAFDGISFTGRTDRDIFREGLAVVGRSDDEIHQVEERYLVHLEREVQQRGDSAEPAMVQLIRRLSGMAHVTLGLVTGNVRRAATLKLAPSGLNEHFHCGAFGCESHDRAELVRRAIGRAEQLRGQSFPRSRICHVGDAASDILAARDNGIIAVGIGAADATAELVRLGAHHLYAPDVPVERFVVEVLG